MAVNSATVGSHGNEARGNGQESHMTMGLTKLDGSRHDDPMKNWMANMAGVNL